MNDLRKKYKSSKHLSFNWPKRKQDIPVWRQLPFQIVVHFDIYLQDILVELAKSPQQIHHSLSNSCSLVRCRAPDKAMRFFCLRLHFQIVYTMSPLSPLLYFGRRCTNVKRLNNVPYHTSQ